MTKIQEFNDFAIDIKQSVLWQYNEATNLLSLIEKKQLWYDVYQSAFWGIWHEVNFDLTNADIFGCAVWSIIFDVPLLVSDLPYIEQPTLGFNAYVVTALTDTTLLSIGMRVTGTGTSADTVVTLIPSSTSIYISHLMTADATETLTFALDQTGTTTSGSAIVAGLSDTSVLSASMDVSGTGIPGATTILNIIDGNSITLDANTTASGSTLLTFSLEQDGDLTDPGLQNNYKNYVQGNFSQFNQNLNLRLEEQRWMLRLKYFQLTTLTNIAGFSPNLTYSINEFLNYLCTDNDIGYGGTIYVLDNLNMTMTYHFTTTDFPSALLNVLIKYDVWPRPAGVGVLYTGLT